MQDVHNNLIIEQNLAPAVQAGTDTTVNGAIIDMQGAEAGEVSFSVGIEGDALSGAVKIELGLEKATLANFSDAVPVVQNDLIVDDGVTVDGNGVIVTIDDNAEAPAIHNIGFNTSYQYVRPLVNLVGANTNGTPKSPLHSRNPFLP